MVSHWPVSNTCLKSLRHISAEARLACKHYLSVTIYREKRCKVKPGVAGTRPGSKIRFDNALTMARGASIIEICPRGDRRRRGIYRCLALTVLIDRPLHLGGPYTPFGAIFVGPFFRKCIAAAGTLEIKAVRHVSRPCDLNS